MKTRVAILLVLLLTVITTNAQKKGKKEDFEKMTPEQRTELHLKKMSLALDLTPSQANQIKPLLLKKASEYEKRKAMKKSCKKLTANERYTMKSKILDMQIAFKSEMKRILNEKQYEKFEKSINHKIKRGIRSKKNKHK